MSLLKQNEPFSVRDYLFIALGMLGAIWFFLTYASQDPRSTASPQLDEQSATLKAAEILNSLGYSTGNMETETNYQEDEELLDSLQYRMGRSNAIKALKKDRDQQVFPFYWRVLFTGSGSDSDGDQIGPDEDENGERRVDIRLDEQGKWVEFINTRERFPERILNREALQHAFQSDSTLTLWRSVPDSLWDGILRFNLEEGYDLDQPSEEQSGFDRNKPHEFTLAEIRRLGEFHLGKSAWNTDQFELSSIRVTTLRSRPVAHLQLESKDSILEQDVSLRATVLPTGALLELDAEYNPDSGEGNAPNVWELAVVAVVFLFGIGVIIIFYFRIRARVIDTQSALVISILMGFTVLAIIFLEQIRTTVFFGENAEWFELVGLALQMGLSAAMASIAFFVISAVGDSVTRQHWSEKLACYDYLRQGMFFNKPVGETLVRSVLLMFILAGIWSMVLWLFPNLYFDLSNTFLAYEAAWPPVFMLLNNAWFSLIAILGIFLVAGGQVFAQTKSRWTAGAVMILGVAVINPTPFSFGPASQQFLLMAIFGTLLTYIFLRWDFLTLLFTHYLLINLLDVSSGWIVSNSPDTYIFITFLLFIAFITLGGTVSIVKGKEEQALPDYVPEYVEELAQEERIKQELQIAREVQQSFLPIKTPEIENLDLAAICKPAYETGGDYYDFIQLDDHRVAVAIGDVSGKGIQAAFYMTFTKGILHSLCRETDSPSELLKKANQLFYSNAKRGTFISLIYGIIDTRKKEFRFARAGHNPLIHIQKRGDKLSLLQPNGLGLGLTDNSAFEENIQESTLKLESQDILVLYTDGIVEALNSAHQFYGTKRLKSKLQETDNRTAGEILSNLMEDVSGFAGQARQHDDMTVMVIKLDGEASKKA